MAAFETGTCSVCGREDLRVRKDGTAGSHNSYNPISETFSLCSGYGKLSIERRQADRATTAESA